MKPSVFVGLTSWTGILVIIYGVLFGFLKNEFTTWVMFVFLCLVGILAASIRDKNG